VSEDARGQQIAGGALGRDLTALRTFAWLPILTIVLGVLAALALGAFSTGESQARFRANVLVDALQPLFGPPVLPGPFDYAALATSDAVIDDVADATGAAPDSLRARLRAEPRVNSTEITFSVRGDDALAIARAWESAFAQAAASETAAIQRRLVEPYREQLAQARAQLESASVAARSSPDDAVLAQELAAAEENYETASKLVQSYDVVAATMTARSFTTRAPHAYGGGVGSMPSRAAAGAVIGLVAGVLGGLGLAYVRSHRGEDLPQAPPSSLRRAGEEARTGRR
jgi:hypothetical protein